MITSPIVHTPFAELPVEARALFFINALAAVARYGTQPPEPSELTPVLETIWNGNQLCLKDLYDPFLMTALLKTELAFFSSDGDVQ